MKTNNKQPITISYQLERNKSNSNYKWQFFLESLQTNQQLRHYLMVTALVALAVLLIASALLIPLTINIIGWIGTAV
jgi:hypothetical protein